MLGRIHSFESMGGSDGPGLRYVIFLQGCPMRCIYCHNPDTWAMDGGFLIDSQDLLNKVIRYKAYFGDTGGVTLSGGEPFIQPDFLGAFLRGCKEAGIHTAVDTSGGCMNEEVKRVIDETDLLILDIKSAKAAVYQSITGQSIKTLHTFLDYIVSRHKPFWVRQVIVPGLNDTKEDMVELAEILRGKTSLEHIELLPYHTMGVMKWEKLNLPYPLSNVPPLAETKRLWLQAYLDSLIQEKKGI